MKRHNFFLPEELVDTLRVKAQATGLTMSELIRQVLTEYIKKSA